MTMDVEAEHLRAFCENLTPLPTCSLEVELSGVPSLIMDNSSGTRALTKHLVEAHDYRTFAFVAGPKLNSESQARLLACSQQLKALSLELQSEDIVYGNFMSSSGADAVTTLLDERLREPDIIWAANDSMAFGILKALKNRSGAVPKVCGFDNVVEANFSAPPLSTVE